MPARQPVSADSISGYGAPAPLWAHARKRLAEGATHSPSMPGTYWLATVRPDGRPHVMPLFGVWLDDALYFTSGPGARKARNLAANPHCVVTSGAADLDLVIEGTATRVTDEPTLRRVAESYADKYGWLVRVRDGAFDADHGAPSAGEPPYQVYEVEPSTVFGLGTAEPFGAARWRFSSTSGANSG